MRKKSGVCLMITGTLLLLAALLLLLHNVWENRCARQQAEKVLSDMISTAPVLSKHAEELPEVVLDGFAYVGYIEIPRLGLKLPVMSEWDETRLKIAPCRQFGSSRMDDLVIAAHNYPSHFGRLKTLHSGDSVLFTDMDGIINTYQVSDLAILEPDALAAVRYSGSDLVLYTCTVGGSARVAVFCCRK